MNGDLFHVLVVHYGILCQPTCERQPAIPVSRNNLKHFTFAKLFNWMIPLLSYEKVVKPRFIIIIINQSLTFDREAKLCVASSSEQKTLRRMHLLEETGVRKPERFNIKKVTKESLTNLKITFENFEFSNDVCTRGKALHKLFDHRGLGQIARRIPVGPSVVFGESQKTTL